MGLRKAGPPKHKDHAQDCETLIATEDQRPAILPWSLYFGWHPSLQIVVGILPSPAAGLLLDVGMHDRVRNGPGCWRSCGDARNMRTSMRAQRRMLCFSSSAL